MSSVDQQQRNQPQPRPAVTLATVQRDLQELVAGMDAENRRLRAETEGLRAEKDAEIQRLLAEKGELQRDLASRHLAIKGLQQLLQQLQQLQQGKKEEELEKDGVAVYRSVVQSQAEKIRSLQQKVKSLSLAQNCPDGEQTEAPTVPATSTQHSLSCPGSLTSMSEGEQTRSSNTPFGVQPTDSTSTLQAQHLQAGNDGAGRGEMVVRGAVSDDMIDWLADNVAAKDWKPLVRKLGLSNQECDDIVANAAFDIREKRLKAFQHWKMTRPQLANVDVLLKTMEDKKLYQTARDFRAAHNHPGSVVYQSSSQSLGIVAADGPQRPVKSEFQRFLLPFIQEDKLPMLEKQLRQCSPLSVNQGQQLGGRCAEIIKQGKKSVDTVLRQMCFDFYADKKTEDEYEKCVALWKFIEVCDVRESFKKFVDRGGVIGPKNKCGKIAGLTYTTNDNVEKLLSLVESTWSWKDLAETLKERYPKVFAKVTKVTIRDWEKTPLQGAQNILQIWQTTTEDSVDVLYTLAVKNGRWDIAQALE